mmetsp:Transcript_50287/g.98580  ORF Transcript_50287/g.98580 Transcript_50287/m.98580 type:complete len:127 (+) Transcript_50287:58-438(+)
MSSIDSDSMLHSLKKEVYIKMLRGCKLSAVTLDCSLCMVCHSTNTMLSCSQLAFWRKGHAAATTCFNIWIICYNERPSNKLFLVIHGCALEEVPAQLIDCHRDTFPLKRLVSGSSLFFKAESVLKA